jgi:sugar phosphate isomerase/epimerase
VSGDIKRGVSLYSFQEEFFLRKLDLEQCIAVASEIGATGIETLAEQMMPGFPRLSDAFYDQWHGWMEQYGTTAVAHDMFLDTKRYKDRLLTHEEMVESVHRDIEHAARLGCSVIRMIVITPPEVMEAAAPLARERGVWLGLEVHAPWDFEHEWIQRHLEVADRVGNDVLGLIPDMGAFARRFPRVMSDRCVRDGAHAEIVARIVAAYDEGEELEALPREVEAMGGNELDLALAEQVKHHICDDPAKLTEYAPFIRHVHAKFYEMTGEGSEYSIPYDEIVAALRAGGYRGWLSSEYEGNRHIQDAFEVDSVEQVRRHQQMLDRLLSTNGNGSR